jgi:uncharacterized protein (TIGR00369 family)
MADALLADLRELLSASPFYRWSGIEIDEARPGAVTLRLDLAEHHLNVQGLAHGGVLATLADAAMGLSVRSALEPGRRHVTIEMGVHYLRAVRRGTVQASGRAIRVGREIAYAEADVADVTGRLLARASGTYSVTRPPEAQ